MQLHSSNLIQLCKLPISLTDAFFRSAFEVSENFIKIKKTIYIIYLLNQIPYSIMIKCTKYLTKAQESKYWISHWEIQPLIVTSQFLRYKRDAYNVAESLEKKKTWRNRLMTKQQTCSVQLSKNKETYEQRILPIFGSTQ